MTRALPITERQALLDAFYHKHGPCCAGCDWWRHINAMAGECIRSAPVAGDERAAMFGISGSSLAIGAGHVMTPREHVCGEFKDDFDWSRLERKPGD